MEPLGRRKRGDSRSVLEALAGEFAGEPLRLARQSAMLLVLSALDLLMTYALLRSGMSFYESNPVAAWWFGRWNMAGMTVFKFLVIAVAIVACEVVERRRRGLGRAVLGLGNLAAGGVVAYSLSLFIRHVVPDLG